MHVDIVNIPGCLLLLERVRVEEQTFGMVICMESAAISSFFNTLNIWIGHSRFLI
jgi:hypothetical protein